MTDTHTPTEWKRRREDHVLITGHAHYVDDVRPPGRPAPLHMAVIRSPYAHADIQQIQLDAARALPGVVAALAASELVQQLPDIETMPIPNTLRRTVRKPLALQRVRYVGDPVAVVVAEDHYTALDACDLVDIDYLPLPAVADPEDALAPGAPALYDELGSNIAFHTQIGGGDIEAAFAQADHTTRLRIVNQRVAASTMEPRACLFDFDPSSGEFTAWLSSQAIYTARMTLAAYLGIELNKIRVFNAEVGGAFGTKSAFVGEEIAAAALAVRLGRPVKWIENRSENLQTQTQGRGQINYIEAAYQADGRLLGLKMQSIGDLGGFLSQTTSMVSVGTASMLNGPYRIQAVQSQVIGAFTNKVPTGAYRGAGRPEATFILERVMDRIAHELGLDPAEVRRRNFIAPDAFPYPIITGGQYDSGNYQAALERVLELSDYKGWRTKQQEARQQNSPRFIGLGFSTFVEVSGGAMSPPMAPQEAATVRIRRDGTILVLSGVATNGQGHFTSFAQIASAVFGVPGSQVEVQMNDSRLPGFSVGTFGSRTLQTSGTVVHLAAVSARDKAFAVAARHLEAAPADLELLEGRIRVRGVPARAVTLGELARMVEEQPDLIEHDKPNPVNGTPIEGLAAWHDFRPSNATYCSGAHLAVVEVDSETGDIHILQYSAVDDSGNILNHTLVEGQVHGSLAQGIGQALYEEAAYTPDGQPLAGTLMDYTMPIAAQLPSFQTDFVETPSPVNPLGVKGIGESGTTAAPPAIVNAVLDALAPLGVKTIDMPLRPEKVWAKIEAARSGTLQEPDPIPPTIFNTLHDAQEGGTSTFA